MELEGAAENRSQAAGVSPSTLGSSGTLTRNWSSCSLNSTIVTFEIFLMDGGRQLNSFGPFTLKDYSLSFPMDGEPFKGGTITSLPILSL